MHAREASFSYMRSCSHSFAVMHNNPAIAHHPALLGVSTCQFWPDKAYLSYMTNTHVWAHGALDLGAHDAAFSYMRLCSRHLAPPPRLYQNSATVHHPALLGVSTCQFWPGKADLSCMTNTPVWAHDARFGRPRCCILIHETSAEWQECMITFKDRPKERHLLQFCDIIQAIRALLGNIRHTAKIVY